MDIESHVSVWSDTAEFVLFEHDEIVKYAGLEADWCSDEDVQVKLANAGIAVFIPVGVDGGYTFRITTGELTSLESQAIQQTARNFWLDVKGRELAFGGLEVLPTGKGGETLYIDESEYTRIQCEPGRYHVDVYRLIGQQSPPLKDSLAGSQELAPAYVIRLIPFADEEKPQRLEGIPLLSALESES